MSNNIFDNNTMNPFNDPEFKKEFLKDKGLLDSDKDYEVLSPTDEIESEPGKMINPVTIINNSSKIPSNVSTIIHDASSVKSIDKVQKSKEIKSALNKIFTDYNEKYGLNFHIDLENTANMLAGLSDPKTFRTFQLYLNNAFDRFRSIIYLKVMQGMTILIDDILSPKTLLGSDLELSDKFIVVEKLANLFIQFESFKDSIKIEGADAELRNLGNEIESSDDSNDIRNNTNVKEFMEAMINNTKK